MQNLPAGAFDKALGEIIAGTPDFVPILTPKAITEGKPEADWFLSEVEMALASGRNICPLVTESLDLSKVSNLPDPLSRIRMHHAISYNHDYCDAVMDRLCQLLSKPAQKKSHGIQFLLGFGSRRTILTIGFTFLSAFLIFGLMAIHFGRQIVNSFSTMTHATSGQASEAQAQEKKGDTNEVNGESARKISGKDSDANANK